MNDSYKDNKEQGLLSGLVGIMILIGFVAVPCALLYWGLRWVDYFFN